MIQDYSMKVRWSRLDGWYLGVFAWVFITAVIGYGTYTLVGPVRLVLRKVMSA